MIVILGGGPAGRLASIRLASAEKQVTLVENGGIGGQCLHSGCMPVCAMNDVARLIHSARELHDLGVVDSVPVPDFPVLLKKMGEIQQKITSILDEETRSAGVEIIYGKTGRLSEKRVFAGDEELKADAVIAATGSRPFVPRDPGCGSSRCLHIQNPSRHERAPGKDGHHRGQRGGRGVRVYLFHVRV